ncbi:MAG TPA: OmpA family protein [Polyangia bacterium]
MRTVPVLTLLAFAFAFGGVATAAEAAGEAPTAAGRPSLAGPIGLFGTSTAEVGQLHQLRVGLHAEYFSASDFLILGDSDQRLRSELGVGFTLLHNLELFGALLNSSNRNDRTRAAGDRDPELVKSNGDLILGAKGVYPLSPVATIGFELGLKFLAGVSQLALSPSSTSLWLGPVFTYDLRNSPRPLPVRLHAAASFYADNSSHLREFSTETRNTKEAAMFGYGIAPSRFRVALAADAPLPRGKVPFPIDPFIEYHVEVATGGADQTFAAYSAPSCDKGAGSKPCIDNRDAHWATFGVRAVVFRDIAAELGLDLRVRSPGFTYGVPVPPYNVVFGLSVPFDIDALTRKTVVTKTVEIPAVPEGHVTGEIRGSEGGKPVAGAVVTVAGHPHANAAADETGTFTTVSLSPGPVALQVTAPGFEPLTASAQVVAGKATTVQLVLKVHAPSATVHGHVSNREGKGLEATIKLAGRDKTDGIFETRANAKGDYTLSLPVGSYRVRADAAGLPAQENLIELALDQDRQLDFVLRPAPSNPDVVLGGDSIRLQRPVRFVGSTAKLAPPSEGLLDAVAELLVAHPEIHKVSIVAHWDSSLMKPGPAELTRAQAEAVKTYLVAHGVGAERLSATGAGATQPLVPSLSPASRLRNRRVELHLE